jgi:hypothetical protein
MVEREPVRPGKYRLVHRAPDDYDTSNGEEGIEEEAEHDGTLHAASAGTHPDVRLDVPVLRVEEVNLEVEDLSAQASLRTEVFDLFELKVGTEVSLGKVSLDIKGVDAIPKLKVRLDKVAAIIDRVMATIDRVMATIDENPQILKDLTRGLDEADIETGRGAGSGLEDAGEGAGSAAVDDVRPAERPSSPPRGRPRRARRREPPAETSYPRQDQGARRDRRMRPE